ncbi:aldehyde dehydrogenase family protein [Acidovorax sp. BLS4]|uniref:aldehyde dehydrogenase family protein n=1 Tax=Acidovorax sp. BLS4 TaxID=3273430 RepID=UPI0029439B4D|nr:aldehyde dehydrogenase family protein [Paracidovorax avenae]WOI48190.1 aldehyde dehydrogenase family protein [Paracidovorax avenae]
MLSNSALGRALACALEYTSDTDVKCSRDCAAGVDGFPSGVDMLLSANFGRMSSVWTQNLSQALEYSDRLQAGTVWVNSHTLIDANLPFGGMKQSGTGRDFGPDWLDGWCETKSVCVRY